MIKGLCNLFLNICDQIIPQKIISHFILFSLHNFHNKKNMFTCSQSINKRINLIVLSSLTLGKVLKLLIIFEVQHIDEYQTQNVQTKI